MERTREYKPDDKEIVTSNVRYLNYLLQSLTILTIIDRMFVFSIYKKNDDNKSEIISKFL